MDKKKMLLTIMILDILDNELSELIESAIDSDHHDPIIPILIQLVDSADEAYYELHQRLLS